MKSRDKIKTAAWVGGFMLLLTILITPFYSLYKSEEIYLISVVLWIAFGICVNYAIDTFFNDIDKIKRVLKNMIAGVSKCPNCEKPIPKGNFAFCPSCGASLTQGA